MTRRELIEQITSLAALNTAQKAPKSSGGVNATQDTFSALIMALEKISKRATERTFFVVDKYHSSNIPYKNLSLAELANTLGLSIAKIGTVTALVPTNATALNTSLGEADLLSGLQRESYISLLLSSLNESQLRAISSHSGLGMAALTNVQRNLFAVVLPDPFVLIAAPSQHGEVGKSEVRLTDEQMAQVKIRLNISVDLVVTDQDNKTLWISSADIPSIQQTKPLKVKPNASVLLSAYGREVKIEAPNKRKKSALTLSDTGSNIIVSILGCQTVGEVISAISAKIGVIIRADARVASLRVWCSKNFAAAGDLLNTLSLSVMGTYRKLGRTYILTSDLEGIGTSVAQIFEWQQSAVAMNSIGENGLEILRKKIEGSDWTTLFYQDQLVSEPKVRELLNEPVSSGNPEMTRAIGWEELPTEHQHLLSKMIDYQPRKIQYQPQITLSYILPNDSEADDLEPLTLDIAAALRTRSKTIAKKVDIKHYFDDCVLIFDTKVIDTREGSNDVQTLLASIRNTGVTEIWLKLSWASPLNNNLNELVNSLQKQNLKVGILFSTLKLNSSEFNALKLSDQIRDSDIDLNIRLENSVAFQKRVSRSLLATSSKAFNSAISKSGIWICPDSLFSREHLPNKLKSVLSNFPNIDTVVLGDILPPGYASVYDSRLYAMADGGDYGYSEAMRSEFFQQASCDPIDIVSFQAIRADLTLPFFPTGHSRPSMSVENGNVVLTQNASLEARWNEFRYSKVEALIRNIRKSALDGKDTLWLFSTKNSVIGWLFQDQKESTKHNLVRATEVPPRLLPAVAKQGSKKSLLLVKIYSDSLVWEDPLGSFRLDEFPENVLEKGKSDWAGVAIDATELPYKSLINQLQLFSRS